MNILRISAYYHDSAAALLRDDQFVAAAQEERFTRKKHDPAFRENAVRYRLAEARLALTEFDHVVFYDKPLISISKPPKGENGKTILMFDLMKDLWEFTRERKKFWMAPIVIVMVIPGGLLLLAQGSAIAPFIYTLF